MSEISFFNIVDAESQIREATEKAERTSENLIAAAKKKSEEILSEALKKRNAVYAKAKEEGFQAGHDEGFKKGQAKGEEDLIATHKDSLQGEADELALILKALPESLSQERETLLDETRRDLMNLILDVIKLVIRREVEKPNELTCRLLDELIVRLIDRRCLSIEAHADHIQALEKFLPELKQRFTDLNEIKLCSRDDLDKCRVIVKNEKTRLESSPEETLNRLIQEWGL